MRLGKILAVLAFYSLIFSFSSATFSMLQEAMGEPDGVTLLISPVASVFLED